MFDNIGNYKFASEGKDTLITAMVSSEGEVMKFEKVSRIDII